MGQYLKEIQPYLQTVNSEYKELLNYLTDNPGNEKKLQAYLEGRQLLLPGLNGVYEETNHGVYSGIIFSQLSLPGMFRRIPDFVFVTKTSVQLQVVFIEIEDPAKKYFNQDDSFTSDFVKAYQQLEDWKIWFDDANNKSLLREILNRAINHSMMRTLPMKAEYILIYGRNSEYMDMDNRIRRLSEKSREPYKVMSFDRLNSYPFTESLITVKRDDNGFYAIQVNELYNYEASMRSSHRHIRNKEEAVKANLYINDSQKEDLLQKIKLWDGMSDNEAMKYQLDRVMKKKI